MDKKRLFAIVAVQWLAVTLTAQQTSLIDPIWEKIVIPMNWTTPRISAFGAQWETRRSLHNAGDHDIATQPYGVNCRFNNCPLPPNATATIGTDVNREIFMFVKRADTPSLSVSLCAYDAAQPGSVCTQIPLGRDVDFRPHLTFLEVPAPAGLRHALRVYVLESLFEFPDPVLLNVTLYKIAKSGAESSPEVRTFAAHQPPPLARGLSPAALLVDDFSQFGDFGDADHLRIDVEPVSPDGLHLWGFVSAIDNATNHILTVTP